MASQRHHLASERGHQDHPLIFYEEQESTQLRHSLVLHNYTWLCLSGRHVSWEMGGWACSGSTAPVRAQPGLPCQPSPGSRFCQLLRNHIEDRHLALGHGLPLGTDPVLRHAASQEVSGSSLAGVGGPGYMPAPFQGTAPPFCPSPEARRGQHHHCLLETPPRASKSGISQSTVLSHLASSHQLHAAHGKPRMTKLGRSPEHECMLMAQQVLCTLLLLSGRDRSHRVRCDAGPGEARHGWTCSCLLLHFTEMGSGTPGARGHGVWARVTMHVFCHCDSGELVVPSRPAARHPSTRASSVNIH